TGGRVALAVLDQPANQLELRPAGVLELVDQQHPEARLFQAPNRQVTGEQVAREPRQVVEVEGGGTRLFRAVPPLSLGRDERQVAREAGGAYLRIALEDRIERVSRRAQEIARSSGK